MLPLLAVIGLIPAWLFINQRGGHRQWVGVLAAGLAFLFLESPLLLSRTGMDWALSEKTDKQNRGLSLLRRWGNEQILLAHCYGVSGALHHPLHVVSRLLHSQPVPYTTARRLFYQVYGVSFNERPAPGNIVVDPRLEQAGSIELVFEPLSRLCHTSPRGRPLRCQGRHA
ncbi:MAG: hypothetical protein KBG07_07255 [Elusimicrobia bacterium]|nr:hypothetical protein [Elusimicrobiota bacterium]